MSVSLNQTLKTGYDPEFFIVNSEKEVLASEQWCPKVRTCKSELDWGDTRSTKIFSDGVQAEFNTPPGTCREYIQDNIWLALSYINETLGEFDILISPSVRIGLKTLEGASEKCFIVGCQPDIDAYTGTENIIRVDYRSWPYREAGGHIHLDVLEPQIDWNLVEEKYPIRDIYAHIDYERQAKKREKLVNKLTKEATAKIDPNNYAKTLDLVVGIPMVIASRSQQALEARRRAISGRAGAYRFRKARNGAQQIIEYRVPSNYWLKAPELTSFCFGLARMGMFMFYAMPDCPWLKLVPEEKIVDTINYANVEEAYRIFYDKLLPYLRREIIGDDASFKYVPLHSANDSKLNAVMKQDVFSDDWRKEWKLVGHPFYTHGRTAMGFVTGMTERGY